MGIKKYILILTAFFLVQQNALSSEYHLREMAFVTIGGIYSATSQDFFDEYQEIIGGKSNIFNHSPSLGAGLKFWFSEKYRISVCGEYFFSDFSDTFVTTDTLVNGTVTRNISEEMVMHTTPLIISMDYLPVEQQFKTYFSIGAGITFSNFRWEENVNSNRTGDTRVSGVKYHESGIFPVVRIVSGVELDFDKAVVGTVIGNITFELRYTYIFRYMDVFKNIKTEFTSYPKSWNEKYPVLPGYLSLNLQFGIEYFHTIGKN